MQDHLRYREQFNRQSVGFIIAFILAAGALLLVIRATEAIASADPLVMAPISIVLLFAVVAFGLFRRGHLAGAMTVLLAGSSLTMLAASLVFSFTSALTFWLVQAALLMCAGGVLSIRRLGLAVAGTLLVVVLSFLIQRLGLSLGRAYGPQVSDWLALVAVGLLLTLSGVQSLRFARMFEQTIEDLSSSATRLSSLLSDQEATNRRLQESEDRYRLLLEHTPVALARFDTDLRVSYCNPRLLQVFGLGSDASARLTLDVFASTGMLQVLRTVLEGQAGQYEGSHVNASDGRQWWMSLNCTPLYEAAGKVVGGIAAVRDETDRRARELELSRTRDIADTASRDRNRFLSLMSHEIRTPLNEVYGYAQLLMDKRLPEERRQFLKGNILKSSEALMHMLDGVVDASKIEAGLLTLDEKRFEPSHLLRETTDSFQAAAAEKGLNLYCGWQGEDPGYLMGDAPRLRQMLGNLLSNAVKYTPNGFVQVIGEVLGRDDERCALKFSVTDSGLGISRERQASLFGSAPPPAGSQRTDVDTGGLGLAIVRRLATMMGGDVGVASEPGHGSTFWFIVNLRLDERDPWDDGSDDEDGDADASTGSGESVGFVQALLERRTAPAPLPARVADPADSMPRARKTEKKDMNILLVEDNPTNAQLVQDMLELEGFTVFHALNGQEALDALYVRKLAVNVVLMDCRMPVMDGYECTQRIRARETEDTSLGHLPIIALTANVFEDDRNRCLQVGMDDFLRKPVDLNELVKTLNKHAG